MNGSARRGRLRLRPLLALLLASVVTSALITAGPAQAVSYPSWPDVEAARSSEASKKTEIDRIKRLLSALETSVRTSQEAAVQRGVEYEKAQAKLDFATYRADTLRAKAGEARDRADVSRARVGRLIAQLARFSNADPTTQLLLLNGERADALLFRLGTMSKLSQNSNKAFAAASSDANTAKALTDQATVAQATLADLNREAEKALQNAVAAATAAQTQLVEQQQVQGTLQAQLSVLVENRKATEADFSKGEAIRRQQQEAAAAVAAAAAAAAGGAGSSADGGQLSGQGWTKPVTGRISDRFGPRPNRPTASSGAFHYGTDLAAGCGTPIYAATAGRVVYAGWLGTYGNWVLLDHGSGVMTGYAHIREGGILVNVGQTVQAGQNIAQVGTTGASSGCHLHFEVRVGGNRVDPQPFMGARGVTLG